MAFALPPLRMHPLIARWICATIALSLLFALDRGALTQYLALAPSAIWHGQVWRLVTWPFVEDGPRALIFTCIAIYKLGGDLVVRWGSRRLLRVTAKVVLACGVATCALAVVVPPMWFSARFAGWALDDALVILWARQFPNTPLQLYGLLTVSGRQLVAITIAFTAAYAIYSAPWFVVPELVACAGAALYPRRRLAAR